MRSAQQTATCRSASPAEAVALTNFCTVVSGPPALCPLHNRAAQVCTVMPRLHSRHCFLAARGVRSRDRTQTTRQMRTICHLRIQVDFQMSLPPLEEEDDSAVVPMGCGSAAAAAAAVLSAVPLAVASVPDPASPAVIRADIFDAQPAALQDAACQTAASAVYPPHVCAPALVAHPGTSNTTTTMTSAEQAYASAAACLHCNSRDPGPSRSPERPDTSQRLPRSTFLTVASSPTAGQRGGRGGVPGAAHGGAGGVRRLAGVAVPAAAAPPGCGPAPQPRHAPAVRQHLLSPWQPALGARARRGPPLSAAGIAELANVV